MIQHDTMGDYKIEMSIPVAARCLLFLGVGQQGSSFRSIAKDFPDTVVVGPLPYHLFPQAKFEDIATKIITEIIEKNVTSYHIESVIAESQSAPGVVQALARMQCGQIKNVVLMAPLGLNKSALGNDPAMRYKELILRSRQFWLHKNQRISITGNRNTLTNIVWSFLRYWRRFRDDYTAGANQDITQSLSLLASQSHVTIYADSGDSLFPYNEIAKAVQGLPISLHKTSYGSHLNRATPLGIKELRQVIQSVSE
mgnify:CR=1 FL=1